MARLLGGAFWTTVRLLNSGELFKSRAALARAVTAAGHPISRQRVRVILADAVAWEMLNAGDPFEPRPQMSRWPRKETTRGDA